MKIRPKLVVLNLGLILPFVAASIYTVVVGGQNRNLIEGISESSFPNAMEMQKFQAEVLDIQQNFSDAGARRDAKSLADDLSKSQEDLAGARANLAAMKLEGGIPGVTEEQLKESLKKAQVDLASFFDVGTRMARAYVAAGSSGADAAAANALMEKFDAASTTLVDEAARLQKLFSEDLTGDLVGLKGSLERTSIVSAVFVAVAIGLAVLLSLLIAASFAGPLRRFVELTSVVAQGNLSRKVFLKRKDELGDLAQNFNSAVEHLRGIITQIKSSSSASQGLSDQLSGTLQQSSAALSQITANIDSMTRHFAVLVDNLGASSSAMEEISANVGSLAERIDSQASAITETSASVEEMSASIESVARIAREKAEATSTLKEITGEGGKRVEITSQIVSSFSRSAGDMLEMIKLINEIANRTDLLSMNAAIEAAHAGSYGKGFAVVADEIRGLAESTASHAKKISVSLKAVIARISEALDASAASGEAFRKISATVEEVVDAFAEITSSTGELAIGSREILKSATALTGITEEIRSGSAEMKLGVQEASTSLVRIKDISTDSLQELKEISKGAGEISGSVSRISDLGVQNGHTIQRLSDEVASFVTEEGGNGKASGVMAGGGTPELPGAPGPAVPAAAQTAPARERGGLFGRAGVAG